MKSLEQWLGVLIWCVVTLAIAVLGVFFVPLATSGGVHIPISLLVVVVANVLLPSVFTRGLELAWAWFVPPLIWVIVVIPSASLTGDGDILLPGSPAYSSTLNLIYLGLGVVAAIVGAYVARMDFNLIRQLRRTGERQK
ncbi:hypothetical protein CLV47_11251 [Antricoccus suffuscus]|uniref:Uncharacterized protein n=1 Tax=Antricoccus suffuscus TaxID=1629062 RepID=A0A2T0ZY58_9ACTN|nr:hypothetical protein [Antricoccus suffuscus]PRZ41018.1 hypothetical protein CLV47_11251 [Antricoccus suffuscus]